MNDYSNETIAENIRKYRKRKKMTQSDLAKEIGKSLSSIKKYETGLVAVPQMVLLNIASALDVMPFDFYYKPDQEHRTGFVDGSIIREINAPPAAHRSANPDLFAGNTSLDYAPVAENRIQTALRLLNTEGKIKVASYAEDLTRIPDYLNKEE